MPAQEDAGARVESILDKVDREVARRRAQQQQSPPPIPEALQDAAPAPVAPPAVPPAAAAPPAAPPAPAPAAPAPVPAPEPGRPISLTDPNAPTPVTTQELSSGLAAARRRLAIVNTQLDELASEIEALNDQARRIREERLAQSARPALSPRPVTLADQEASAPEPIPIPVEPAPGPAALPTAAASIPAPEEPARPPLGAPEPIPEPPKQESPTAGMRVRPRPPAQSQRRVPAADQARLVAVELAVSGQTRGDVAELLAAQYADVDPQAILDSLFGPGTPPSARMSGT